MKIKQKGDQKARGVFHKKTEKKMQGHSSFNQCDRNKLKTCHNNDKISTNNA